jgi:multiple sugar transport system substrate-binding protein
MLSLMPLLDDINKEQFEYIETAAANSSAIFPPPPSGHMEIVDLKQRLMMSVMYGTMEPLAAAQEFRKQATIILNKNN